MPLNIDIRINGDLIETINVGRQEQLEEHDALYVYTAWVEGHSVENASFMHNYSHGARVCAQKALEALGRQA